MACSATPPILPLFPHIRLSFSHICPFFPPHYPSFPNRRIKQLFTWKDEAYVFLYFVYKVLALLNLYCLGVFVFHPVCKWLTLCKIQVSVLIYAVWTDHGIGLSVCGIPRTEVAAYVVGSCFLSCHSHTRKLLLNYYEIWQAWQILLKWLVDFRKIVKSMSLNNLK